MTKWEKFCGFMLRKLGWTVDGEVAPEKVAVLLAVPHTSIWDFPVCYLYYKSLGQKPHAIVKKEMFFWPLGPILSKLGAIPIDRRNSVGTIKGVIDRMKNTDEKFHLSIAPEGTRGPVKHWKTGYHTIARALNCPVYLGYVDWGTKHIGYTRTFPLTDNPREDTEKIQQIYASMNVSGKHPEKFVTE